ncbi:MAG: beta-L-arabinofuranosidase domain-containing protein, partial [Armatimonadaceae bacterium]
MNVTQDQHSPVPTASASAKAADRLSPAPAGTVQIQGWLGERMDACIEHRVMAQSLDAILTPFRERTEHDGSGWRCEYWGKWMTSAVLATRYQPSESHRAVIDNGVARLRETQTDDGYIGTYTDETHLGIWDVWGRKYVLLGL